MKQGDLVMIEFPFADMTVRKLRPAIILSNAAYNRHSNVLLAGVYGKQQPFSIQITNADMHAQQLQKPSYISFQNIVSTDKKQILYKADALKKVKLHAVLKRFAKCL